MADWLERYQAGECAAVWDEMQALGDEIAGAKHRKAAHRVARETMSRARQNVLRLLEELSSLGYRFHSTTVVDHPLELRIEHALEYVRRSPAGGKRADPWAHPALAWIDEEEIDVPVQFLNGKPARSNYRPPSARTKAALLELGMSLALRGWFETVGSVDLVGTHPALNPDGTVEVLRVKMNPLPDGGSGAGAGFVAAIRHAFEWGGFPGWSSRPDPPERELDWLRSKLLPL